MSELAQTVLLLGATGTIGRATARALTAAGHRVVAATREDCAQGEEGLFALMTVQGCQAVISCLASRSGTPQDARAVDYGLNRAALRAAVRAGIGPFVLLSAICVQKPRLAFQHAKLAFEAELQAAPLAWSIVRPTAYFKSLSGQVGRLRRGKPFLLFGDGALTACKPISDDDLARYLVLCLSDPALQGRILPIGGPGPAIPPRAQGEMLFRALDLPPRFSLVPLGLMSVIIWILAGLGQVLPRQRDKAELARIALDRMLSVS